MLSEVEGSVKIFIPEIERIQKTHNKKALLSKGFSADAGLCLVPIIQQALPVIP
jgi:hypothetical protein